MASGAALSNCGNPRSRKTGTTEKRYQGPYDGNVDIGSHYRYPHKDPFFGALREIANTDCRTCFYRRPEVNFCCLTENITALY